MAPNPAWSVDASELVPNALTTPGAPATTLDSLPSKICPADGPSGTGIMNLADASNSGYFVTNLRSQSLLFRNAQMLGSGWGGSLDTKDTLQRWLSAFFIWPVSKPAVNFTGDLSSPFNIKAQILLSMTGATDGFFYSSVRANLQTAFNVTANATPVIDDFGFF